MDGVGVVDGQQCMAIRLRSCHFARADRAAGPRLVLDDELLPHLLGQFLGHFAGDGIDGATWRIGYNDADRPGRIGVGSNSSSCSGGNPGECGAEGNGRHEDTA